MAKNKGLVWVGWLAVAAARSRFLIGWMTLSFWFAVTWGWCAASAGGWWWMAALGT